LCRKRPHKLCTTDLRLQGHRARHRAIMRPSDADVFRLCCTSCLVAPSDQCGEQAECLRAIHGTLLTWDTSHFQQARDLPVISWSWEVAGRSALPSPFCKLCSHGPAWERATVHLRCVMVSTGPSDEYDQQQNVWANFRTNPTGLCERATAHQRRPHPALLG